MNYHVHEFKKTLLLLHFFYVFPVIWLISYDCNFNFKDPGQKDVENASYCMQHRVLKLYKDIHNQLSKVYIPHFLFIHSQIYTVPIQGNYSEACLHCACQEQIKAPYFLTSSLIDFNSVYIISQKSQISDLHVRLMKTRFGNHAFSAAGPLTVYQFKGSL